MGHEELNTTGMMEHKDFKTSGGQGEVHSRQGGWPSPRHEED